MKPKCLIYCRVSSERQVKEGNGLESQEKRCRDHAKSKGYVVVAVFLDEGVSGRLFDRPAMQKLIEYLDKHKAEKFIIIFDDLARFARDVQVHIQLKTELVARGAKLECLNFNFDDSPESEFAELVVAASAQLNRRQNARQVIQKQKSRLELGYWPFCQPPGLVFTKDQVHGKLLVRDEPLASIYAEAINKYVSNSLNTYEETKNFILDEYKKHGIKRKLSLSGTQNILKEILYCGYVEYQPWGVSLRKGHHKGFITLETYNRVQEKMKNRANNPSVRRDFNPIFPLRSFILCCKCNKPLTGGCCHGRNNHGYLYYWCKQKSCENYGKTVKAAKINAEFELLFKKITLSPEKINLMNEILKDTWARKKESYIVSQTIISQKKAEIDKKINGLVDEISTCSNDRLKARYKNQILVLDQELKELENQTTKNPYTPEQFRTTTDTVLSMLKEPVAMWKSKEIEHKKTILRMYFDQKLTYDLKDGFRNMLLAHIVKLIDDVDISQKPRVEMPGVEPGSGETLIKKFN